MPNAVKANCVELTVVEGRCVYLNNHRIVGNKPYVSENLRHSFYQVPVDDVLSALGSTIEQSSIVAATVKPDLTVEPVSDPYKLTCHAESFTALFMGINPALAGESR